jgi:hypothetical protein
MIDVRSETAHEGDGGEMLQRIVDAFVDQSVPLGPDAAIKRRLLAVLAGEAPSRFTLAGSNKDQVDLPAASHVGSWRVVAGLAAAVLVVATVGYLIFNARRDATIPNGYEVAKAAVEPEAAGRGANLPSDESLLTIISAVIRDNPDLANAERWRPVQERLTYAFDRPEVIGMGVGLIGTLPWTTVGRF